MSQNFAALQNRIATVEQLGGVIGAMRGIAALRAQQSRNLLTGIRAYAAVVAHGLTQALAACPDRPPAEPRRAPPLMILFCAEQGFAGAFSERIFAAAGPSNRPVLMIGSRGARLAPARGVAIAATIPLMSHVDKLNPCCERLHQALLAILAAEETPCPVEMIHARPAEGNRVVIERRALLPLDLGAFSAASRRPPPLTTLSPDELIASLSREYIIAALSEALLHSYAAENLARMQAMASARDNIVRKLEGLSADERRLRQNEITEEIIELVTSGSAFDDQGSRPV